MWLKAVVLSYTILLFVPCVRTASLNADSTRLTSFDHGGNTSFDTDSVPLNAPCPVELPPTGMEQWVSSKARDVFAELLDEWTSRQKDNPSKDPTFPQFVWRGFGFTHGDNDTGNGSTCGDLVRSGCLEEIPCKPPLSAAAGAIMNSIVSLKNMFTTLFGALRSADSLPPLAKILYIEDRLDANGFLEVEDQQFIMRGIRAVGAYSTSAMVKSLLNSSKTPSASKDPAIALARSVQNLMYGRLNANISEPMHRAGMDKDVQSAIKYEYGTLYDAFNGTAAKIDNVDESKYQDLIGELFGSGAMLDHIQHRMATRENFTQGMQRLLYATALQTAWKKSLARDEHSNLPFILRRDASEGKCGTIPPNEVLANFFSRDLVTDALWCDAQGNSWWLLRGKWGWRPFEPLPGANNRIMNGKNFGGITIGDIIRSSWGGFLEHGRSNEYDYTETSGVVGDDLTIQYRDEDKGLPFIHDVLTPGAFHITICLDWKEAAEQLADVKTARFACGKNPRPEVVTPGYCKVHVTQYQRNEGNLNPLQDDFQYEIEIHRGHTLVGQATKQPGSSPLNVPRPLKVVNSNLLRDMVINQNSLDDNSKISFWYGDQHWDSEAGGVHNCSVGAYDSGSRQMDCNFFCDEPEIGWGPDALDKFPLPAEPINAVSTGDWFRTSPLPPAVKPQTSSHEPGMCKLHVRQHQRHEPANPTDHFQIEAYLWDGKGNAIGATGQVDASDVVQIAGLEKPLGIKTGNGDDDDLQLELEGEKFDCHVGEYDSGARDVDCFFSC